MIDKPLGKLTENCLRNLCYKRCAGIVFAKRVIPDMWAGQSSSLITRALTDSTKERLRQERRRRAWCWPMRLAVSERRNTSSFPRGALLLAQPRSCEHYWAGVVGHASTRVRRVVSSPLPAPAVRQSTRPSGGPHRRWPHPTDPALYQAKRAVRFALATHQQIFGAGESAEGSRSFRL